MAEIEFFISDEPPEALGPGEEMGGPERTRRPVLPHPWTLAAFVLYAAAAALAVAAPFQKVMTVREPGSLPAALNYSVDGWGRRGVAGPNGFHDPRYGVALCACAGGLVLIALALVATLVAPALHGFAKLTAAAGLAATSALGGVLAAMVLGVEAYFDNFHASILSVPRFGGRPQLDLSYGWCVWLSLAAAGTGLLAVVASVLASRAQEHPTGTTGWPGKLA